MIITTFANDIGTITQFTAMIAGLQIHKLVHIKIGALSITWLRN